VKEKRKVCVVTGSRAEYGRVKSILEAIQEHPGLELILVVTGAHLLRKYGESVLEIEKDGFPIAEKVYLIVEGENPLTMTKSTGLGIIELATVYDKYRPDIVVVPTDRFETLSAAIAAAFMNITLVHIQGGETSGTIDESIRHAITKFTNVHFPATEQSRQRLIRMGEDPATVFNVGCPATDLLVRVDPGTREELFKHPDVVPMDGRILHPDRPYLLVVQHPVTTEFGKGYEQIQETLFAVRETGLQSIMLWPNPDAGSDEISLGIRRFILHHGQENLFLYRNFSNELFIRLMYHAACMVGNSSAGIREACYFGVPVVNIGSRQNNRERGSNVMDVWYERKKICEAIQRQLAVGRYPVEMIYGDGTAGRQIAEILSRIPLDGTQKRISY